MSTIQDFHHHVSGKEDAPWIVFLHGLLGFGANWRRVTPFFEERYRLLVFDQRGHGRSFKPAEGYRPEDYASDVKVLFDHYGMKKAFVIGHSMGGRNALCFATTYPECVLKLVIEDIGPDAQPESVERMQRLLKSVPVPFASKLEAKEFFLNGFEDIQLGQYLYSNLSEIDGKVSWLFEVESMIETIRLGRAQDRWNEWFALQPPALVVRGELSKELSQATYREMLRTSRVAKGVEIQGAGHWVHAEKPEEFAVAVLDFFENPQGG